MKKILIFILIIVFVINFVFSKEFVVKDKTLDEIAKMESDRIIIEKQWILHGVWGYFVSIAIFGMAATAIANTSSGSLLLPIFQIASLLPVIMFTESEVKKLSKSSYEMESFGEEFKSKYDEVLESKIRFEAYKNLFAGCLTTGTVTVILTGIYMYLTL